MQEDKIALFDGIDTLKACLDIFTRMLPKIKVNREGMQAATRTGFLNATDMADYLVTRGVPFREAHNCVGRAVAYALSKGKELQDLTLDEFKDFSKVIKEDIFSLLSTRAMIDRRQSEGGTGTDQVRKAIETARRDLQEEEKALAKTGFNK
jgi:argininosuccinate lyase